MKSQMLCIGQELFRNISVISTPNPRFFLIKKMNYESADAFLFDLQTKKLYTTEIMSFYIDQITKIEI